MVLYHRLKPTLFNVNITIHRPVPVHKSVHRPSPKPVLPAILFADMKNRNSSPEQKNALTLSYFSTVQTNRLKCRGSEYSRLYCRFDCNGCTRCIHSDWKLIRTLCSKCDSDALISFCRTTHLCRQNRAFAHKTSANKWNLGAPLWRLGNSKSQL